MHGDCPSSKEQRELEQLQQMLYLEEEQIPMHITALINKFPERSKTRPFKLVEGEHKICQTKTLNTQKTYGNIICL